MILDILKNKFSCFLLDAKLTTDKVRITSSKENVNVQSQCSALLQRHGYDRTWLKDNRRQASQYSDLVHHKLPCPTQWHNIWNAQHSTLIAQCKSMSTSIRIVLHVHVLYHLLLWLTLYYGVDDFTSLCKHVRFSCVLKINLLTYLLSQGHQQQQ